MISQPKLGQRLLDIRREKGLTQEELVALFNVSVRTIQRIESGEVTPQYSTVKILLAALDQNLEEWQREFQKEEETHGKTNLFNKMLILDRRIDEVKKSFSAAWIAGIICMVLGTAELAAEFMVIDHINSDRRLVYTVIKVLASVAFFIFNRGFIGLAILFENSLLKQAAYVMAIIVPALYISDIVFIYVFRTMRSFNSITLHFLFLSSERLVLFSAWVT